MRFKILYILFVISAIFYANFRLPMGLTPRNVMTILIFLECLLEDRRIFMDKWFGLYLIFIVGFGLSSAVTGYFGRFPKYLVGFYFVAYVGYWATRILILKYDGARLFINLMVVLGVINSMVTIGQFYNLSFFTDLPSRIGIGVKDEFLESMDVGDEAYGFNLPGLLPHPVYNGFFVGMVGVLCLYYQKNGLKLLKLAPWVLMVIASYMVQQRGPFFILLLISVFVLLKVVYLTKSRYRLIYTIALLLLLPLAVRVLFSFLMSGESRYSIGLEATGRDSIYVHSIEYIKDNFIFGGKFQLSATRGFAPHNLFLNAWIYGGLLGFVAITWLIVKQCVAIVRTAIRKVEPDQYSYFICGLAFLGFTMNSMLHNTSVVTGNVIIWLLWGVYSAKLDLENEPLDEDLLVE